MEVEPEPRGLKLYAKIPKAVTLADLADALLKLDRKRKLLVRNLIIRCEAVRNVLGK